MTSGYSVEKPNGPAMMTSDEKSPFNPAQAKPEEHEMMQLFHELGNMTKMLEIFSYINNRCKRQS